MENDAASSASGKKESDTKDEDQLQLSTALKLYLYCKEVKSNDEGTQLKLLKYLHHSKNASSNHGFQFTRYLRNFGALSALELALKKLVTGTTLCQPEGSKTIDKIVVTGVSLLNSCYLLDSKARSEACTKWLLPVIVNCLVEPHSEIHISLTCKAAKLLTLVGSEISCVEKILQSPVLQRLLEILEKYLKVAKSCMNVEGSGSGSESDKLKNESAQAIPYILRALGICCSCNQDLWDRSTSNRFWPMQKLNFKILLAVGSVLSTDSELHLTDATMLECGRALTFCCEKMKRYPESWFDDLPDQHKKSMFNGIISCFLRKNDKIALIFCECIHILVASSFLLPYLCRLHLVGSLFQKFKMSSHKSVKDSALKVIFKIAQAAGTRDRYLRGFFVEATDIGATVPYLTDPSSKWARLPLLRLYDFVHVFDNNMKALLEADLLSVLKKIVINSNSIEDLKFADVRKKIHELVSSYCCVHATTTYPFVPTYRCNSPSFLEVRELMKERAKNLSVPLPFILDQDGDKGCCGNISSPESCSTGKSSCLDSDQYSPISSFTFAGDASSSLLESVQEVGNWSPSSDSPEENSKTENPVSREESADVDESPVINKRPKLMDMSKCVHVSKCKEEISCDKSSREYSQLQVAMLSMIFNCSVFDRLGLKTLDFVPFLLTVLIRSEMDQEALRSERKNLTGHRIPIEFDQKMVELCFRILNSLFQRISMFQDLIKKRIPSIIQLLFSASKKKSNGTPSEFGILCHQLLASLSGTKNLTTGWREGFCLRSILVGKDKAEIDKVCLAIPIIFRNADMLRSFHERGKIFEKIFDILQECSDPQHHFSDQFVDCVTAISQFCSSFGMKWTEGDILTERLENMYKQKKKTEIDVDITRSPSRQVTVCFSNGSKILCDKELLVESSPVLQAMFDGGFKESFTQEVVFEDVSQAAFEIFLDQLKNDDFKQGAVFIGGDFKMAFDVNFRKGMIDWSYNNVELSSLIMKYMLVDKRTNDFMRSCMIRKLFCDLPVDYVIEHIKSVISSHCTFFPILHGVTPMKSPIN